MFAVQLLCLCSAGGDCADRARLSVRCRPARFLLRRRRSALAVDRRPACRAAAEDHSQTARAAAPARDAIRSTVWAAWWSAAVRTGMYLYYLLLGRPQAGASARMCSE